MCVGLHQMNIHVIRHATQAFAEVILAEGSEAVERGASGVLLTAATTPWEFARRPPASWRATASRCACSSPCAPPLELSFAVREYGCIAGVNVTASHNPKEYNGYKVYWADGSAAPHHAAAIAKRWRGWIFSPPSGAWTTDEAVAKGMITLMGRGDRREIPRQCHGPDERQGRRGEGGGHLQDGLPPSMGQATSSFPRRCAVWA